MALGSPQTGYTEWEAHNYWWKSVRLWVIPSPWLANVPVSAEVDTGRPGPKLAIFGELDALDIANHRIGQWHGPLLRSQRSVCCPAGHRCCPEGTRRTGWSVRRRDRLVAVPAEEMIQLAFREDLRKKGVIQVRGR